MLPFTDINFFLFACIYIVIVFAAGVATKKKYYSEITFFLCFWYILFYYRYTAVALSYACFGYLFTRFVVPRINHRLVSAIVLAIPMVMVKAKLDPGLLYFAGLSFVSFRAIQVAIDYDQNEPLRPIPYFNFLFFIPSFYIGPLDRYKRFTENALRAYSEINSVIVLKGLQEIVKGVLYKFVIAELILRYWLRDSGLGVAGALETVGDMYAYTMYLFFDFAGYSAMAIGMANFVGIDLPDNFSRPFISQNPAEFWQRWHASLTRWLTDYFFKPFYKWLSQLKSLKKYPVSKQNIAIFFTFFLMAVWNGFESNYIWSGVLYGLYSVVHNTYVINCRKKDRDVVFGTISPVFVKYISVFLVFHLVCFALYVFSGRFHI